MIRKVLKVAAAAALAGLGVAWSWAMGEPPPGVQSAEAVTAALLIGGAVLGGLGGMSSQKAAKTQAKRSRELLRRGVKRARQQLTPEFLIKNAQKLNPLFRELVASGAGPQFQQNVASLLARRGLTGTGIGTALQGAALSAPGIFAAQQSIPVALQLAMARANADLGAGSALAAAPQGPTGGGFASGAAQGLFLGAQALGGLNQNQQQTNPNLVAIPGAGTGQLIPGGNTGARLPIPFDPSISGTPNPFGGG